MIVLNGCYHIGTQLLLIATIERTQRSDSHFLLCTNGSISQSHVDFYQALQVSQSE